MKSLDINKKDEVEEFCKKINISYNFFKYVIYIKKAKYNTFYIPKKEGVREINVPCKELKIIQKAIKEYLENSYLKENSFPNFVKGFVKNESIVTNAEEHYKSRYILNIDLKDFFPSIHFGRVRGLFIGKPFYFSKQMATIIAKIACYNKKLPQGSPLSPLISNLICYKMDYQLYNYVKKYRCKYTRYADDITISTTRLSFPEEIGKIDDNNKVDINEKIKSIISENTFIINDKKLSLRYLNYRQEVTGLVVNEKVNVSKVYLKRIRSELNYFKKNLYLEYTNKFLNIKTNNKELAKEICRKNICGKLNFIKMVKGNRDRVFLKYAKQFNEIFETDFFDVSFLDVYDWVKERCYIIHDFDDIINGTGFLTKEYGLIICTHIFLNSDTVDKLYPEIKCVEKDENLYKKFNLNFFYKKQNEITKHYLELFINKENYTKDVCNCKIDMRKKKFNTILLNYEPKIGEEVYAFCFGNYFNENKNSFKVIQYRITSRDENDMRAYYSLDRPVVHGMSGGPVLNKNMDVIGILSVGSAYSYQEFEEQSDNSGNNGFFLLKDIKDILKKIN